MLDRGLREHPGYLSALVAKGRCHLELGEPEAARGVLERVVKQDATQMVANKLLVRAYLDTGEADKARERLDLYSLLNDSDPEIEELRRRLRAMEQPPQAPPTSDRSFAEAPPPATSGDVFDLGFTPPPAPVRRGGDDLFALDLPAPRPAPAAPARASRRPLRPPPWPPCPPWRRSPSPRGWSSPVSARGRAGAAISTPWPPRGCSASSRRRLPRRCPRPCLWTLGLPFRGELEEDHSRGRG